MEYVQINKGGFDCSTKIDIQSFSQTWSLIETATKVCPLIHEKFQGFDGHTFNEFVSTTGYNPEKPLSDELRKKQI